MQATPALLGDGTGIYRIHITGNSGSGKSTLALRLSAILGLPYISLDQLFWKPGWGETPAEEFQAKLRAAISPEACPRGWIADGDYVRRSGGLVQDGATDVIWLDLPFWVYFPRLVYRTFMRLGGWTEACAPGCEESTGEVFFNRDSIILWCWTQHAPNRARNEVRWREVGAERMKRIGSGAELERWVGEVRGMVRDE